jgi:penicillin amidase
MGQGRDRWTIRGDQTITIVRDGHGVPHVQASTEPDLYRGLGYCHGVDRALQMLVVRIVAQGRGSEYLDASEEMLRLDRFFRRLHFGGDAAAEAAKVSAADRALAEAYSDGVNRALARRAPWELRLVGYRPGPWTLADSLVTSRVVGYVALAQSQGDMERLLVEMVQGGVPREHLEALFPGLLHDLDIELVRRLKLGERLVPETTRWSSTLPRAVASNNWVVGGRKTASGAALLANDPHLEGNRLPAIWYEVVLELPARFCIAATMPGLPGPLLGRTNDLAWGATYAFMDAIDSWIEDCSDGCYRRVTNGRETWEPFRARTEVIKRKRGSDLTVTFHENAHGVLDGDPAAPGLYLATRWATGAGTGAASLAASFGMLHARTVSEGMDLLGRVETAWNWVLADRDGGIGYQMSGRMPMRREGAAGFVPLAGWDPANDWHGFVPASDLPRALNPPCGFIATANDDLNHLGRARPINLPMGAYRAQRIAELLGARDDWTVAATERMQMDVHAPQAARFMEVLRPLLPPGPQGDVLRDWDCRYDLASRGASLFERFYRELIVEVFGRVCGPEVMRFLTGETGILADFYANFDRVLLDTDNVWFGTEGRDATFRRVAARALATPAEPWGQQQQIVMKHLMLGGRLPAWLGFDHGPVAIPGGRSTIHQGQIYRSGGRETSFVPSYRLVTDLSEPAAHTALGGGPSDRRFSRWYASGVEAWLAGRLKRLRPMGGGG